MQLTTIRLPLICTFELQLTFPPSTHTSTSVSGSVVVTVKLFVVMMLLAAKIAAPLPWVVDGVRATFGLHRPLRVPSAAAAVAVTTADAGSRP